MYVVSFALLGHQYNVLDTGCKYKVFCYFFRFKMFWFTVSFLFKWCKKATKKKKKIHFLFNFWLHCTCGIQLPTRDGTHALCYGSASRNHWTSWFAFLEGNISGFHIFITLREGVCTTLFLYLKDGWRDKMVRIIYINRCHTLNTNDTLKKIMVVTYT